MTEKIKKRCTKRNRKTWQQCRLSVALEEVDTIRKPQASQKAVPLSEATATTLAAMQQRACSDICRHNHAACPTAADRAASPCGRGRGSATALGKNARERVFIRRRNNMWQFILRNVHRGPLKDQAAAWRMSADRREWTGTFHTVQNMFLRVAGFVGFVARLLRAQWSAEVPHNEERKWAPPSQNSWFQEKPYCQVT